MEEVEALKIIVMALADLHPDPAALRARVEQILLMEEALLLNGRRATDQQIHRIRETIQGVLLAQSGPDAQPR